MSSAQSNDNTTAQSRFTEEEKLPAAKEFLYKRQGREGAKEWASRNPSTTAASTSASTGAAGADTRETNSTAPPDSDQSDLAKYARSIRELQ